MQDEQTNRRKENTYRPMGELIRGVFFLLFGLFVIFSEKFGFEFNLSPKWLLIIGIVVCIYGLFRVFNGMRKLFINRK